MVQVEIARPTPVGRAKMLAFILLRPAVSVLDGG
jgi:hypothetical protein